MGILTNEDLQEIHNDYEEASKIKEPMVSYFNTMHIILKHRMMYYKREIEDL